LKIIFGALYDLSDINRGSGTFYNIQKELIDQGHDVTLIKLIDDELPFLTKFFRYISKNFLKKRYFSYMDPFIAYRLGRKVARKLNKKSYDCFLTNDYSIASYLKIKSPIVLWTDSIFPRDYNSNKHPWLDNLSWFSIKFSHLIIEKALKNISICIVPGMWNKKEILKYEIIDDEKVSIIPFGANIPDPKPNKNFHKRKLKDMIQLLFIGKDFEVKGLRLAISIVQKLKNEGINVILNVIGNKRPCDQEHNHFIKYYGFLDKSDKEESKLLDSLYRKSDIFLMPSIAEGFGIVYVEAAAYGIPSLGFKTQGVTGAVKNNHSGKLLPIHSDENDFIEAIYDWRNDLDNYKRFCQQARNHYEKNGKWDILITRFIKLIEFN
tara:strand:- start:1414 stop:2550 length:1137 start_codon:yes stop_codon:yes gene_type:complete